MTFSYILGTAVGGAGIVLLWFPLSALAIQSQRKAKLGWKNALIYFLIAIGVMALINIAILLIQPSLLTSSDTNYFSLFHTMGLPLLVSIGTLMLFWKPK